MQLQKKRRRHFHGWFAISVPTVLLLLQRSVCAFGTYKGEIDKRGLSKRVPPWNLGHRNAIPLQLLPLSRHVHTALIRGGGIECSPRLRVSTSCGDDELQDKAVESRNEGISWALMSTYFAVMGAKCALPSVMLLLISPAGLTFPNGRTEPQQFFARLLLLSTAAIAVGKLLLGPIIDFFGGILSLQVSLACLAVLLTSIAFCQSFVAFGISWILVDFIFSSCWAACINAIHQSFPEHIWAKQIGRLAAAARAGNSMAFMLFSFILRFFEGKMAQYWRPVFGMAAVAQLVPIALLAFYGNPIAQTKKVPEQAENPSIHSSLKILKREAATPDFWLHLVSRSALMLFASFLLFVPTLMTQVYNASSALGAQVGSLYAMGCLLSVTTGSKLYARLQSRGKLWLVAGLLLFGATGSSVAQLGHMANWWSLPLNASALTMFVWGFSFAIPFYIPPSLYALSKGGKESSATIADVFDIGGFGLLAAFNGLVASWITNGSKASWLPTFQITTGCSLLSFLALSLAILRER